MALRTATILLGAALAQAAIANVVQQIFCVQRRDGSVVRWPLWVDQSVKSYTSLYLELPNQSPFTYTNVYDLLAVAGANNYAGPQVSNVASNVVGSGTTFDQGVVTSYSMYHFWWYPDNSLAIDMFDHNFSTPNIDPTQDPPAAGEGDEHMYPPAGPVAYAAVGTCESCVGTFPDDTPGVPESNCTGGLQDDTTGYPCAFTNVDLTGTPFTMVNSFTSDSTSGSRHVTNFDSVGNQTINMLAGGNCGYTGPNGHAKPKRNSVVINLWEHLTICPSETSTPTSSSSATGTPSPSTTGTPSSSTTGTPSSSHTGTPSSSTTGTSSSSHTGTPSSSLTGTPSHSQTASATITPSSSHTGTPSSSNTGTPLASQTSTPSSSHTGTPSHSQTRTPSSSHTGTPSYSQSKSPSGTQALSPSPTSTTVADPTPACSGCSAITKPLKCYGDATSGSCNPGDLGCASDWHTGGLPYTLTQARPNQAGECWYGCPLSVEEFVLEFDLSVADLSCERADGDSGVSIVFFNIERAASQAAGGLLGGPANGNPFRTAAAADAAAGLDAPPKGHHGQWEMRLYATTDGLSMWPEYGVSTDANLTRTKPLGKPVHPRLDSASYHVSMRYNNRRHELYVQWSESDARGHNTCKDSRWFSTAITDECGCGGGKHSSAEDAPVACPAGVGRCPSPSRKPKDVCATKCLAGFGLRGWTERHHWARQSITSLEFSLGDHDLVAAPAAVTA